MVQTSTGPSVSNMRYYAVKADQGGFEGQLPELTLLGIQIEQLIDLRKVKSEI